MFSFYFRSSTHVILLLLFFVSNINAYIPSSQSKNGDFDLGKKDLSTRAIANTVPLRILCLGASITYGYGSSDGNGYRYSLRGKLIADGNAVNMVGSISAGNMSDNQVEAWPGYRISQVAAKAKPSFKDMPNVVLIFLGTNDMTQNFEISTAHLRMGALINQIFEIVPSTSVIVSKLLPNAQASAETNTLTFNANLDLTVANLTAQGRKVRSVDMHSDWFSTADLGSDGTHPTELGYLKMARVFYTGIVEAMKAGNISAPVAAKGVDGTWIDDYKAGNDSAAAGTAMDVVCQTTKGETMGTTQKMQCSTSGASPSQTGILNICVVLGMLVVGMYGL